MDLILIGGLGLPELGIILLIVIVIFGASRLPQLGKGLGEGIRNFTFCPIASSEEYPNIFSSEEFADSILPDLSITMTTSTILSSIASYSATFDLELLGFVLFLVVTICPSKSLDVRSKHF